MWSVPKEAIVTFNELKLPNGLPNAPSSASCLTWRLSGAGDWPRTMTAGDQLLLHMSMAQRDRSRQTFTAHALGLSGATMLFWKRGAGRNTMSSGWPARHSIAI